MVNELLLLSGNDIPFIGAQATIHQPSIKEIAYIGEKNFFIGCQFLNFSKDFLSSEDKNHLSHLSNFEILMSIMKDLSNPLIKQQSLCLLSILSLIMPEYNFQIQKDCILGMSKKSMLRIDKSNFEELKGIISQMFCLKKRNSELDYNPGNKAAEKIAEKLRKGREKAARLKGETHNEDSYIFNRYISILSVGLNKNCFDLMNYTVYQLFDEFQRFELKQQFDIYFKAKLAGAKDLKDVDNWMKDFHS